VSFIAFPSTKLKMRAEAKTLESEKTDERMNGKSNSERVRATNLLSSRFLKSSDYPFIRSSVFDEQVSAIPFRIEVSRIHSRL
jgi:hypothetical protein